MAPLEELAVLMQISEQAQQVLQGRYHLPQQEPLALALGRSVLEDAEATTERPHTRQEPLALAQCHSALEAGVAPTQRPYARQELLTLALRSSVVSQLSRSRVTVGGRIPGRERRVRTAKQRAIEVSGGKASTVRHVCALIRHWLRIDQDF
jgi:hypothetical protein